MPTLGLGGRLHRPIALAMALSFVAGTSSAQDLSTLLRQELQYLRPLATPPSSTDLDAAKKAFAGHLDMLLKRHGELTGLRGKVTGSFHGDTAPAAGLLRESSFYDLSIASSLT